MTKTKKLALLAALTAVALTIFVAEAQIPPVVPVPGVKLGLANIVTLVTMALHGRREAGAVLVVRLIPGSAFGASGEGYARISYAYSVDHLQTAMKRIREFLHEHGWEK